MIKINLGKIKNKFEKKNSHMSKFFFKNFFLLLDIFILVFLIVSLFKTLFSILILKDYNKDVSSKNNKIFANFIRFSSENDSISQIKKSVISRNIFDINGEIPDEGESLSGVDFEKVPCTYDEDIPLKVLGIIYTGDPKTNLVTLMHNSVLISDVYKEGQELIDDESYSVYKIPGPSNVQFRHNMTKICVSIATKTIVQDVIDSEKTEDPAKNVYELEDNYLKEEIGPGYSKILSSANLVPNIVDGKMNGFRIVNIKAGTIFAKIEMENGDIITSVNNVDLQDPSKGFKIYESLQNERDILIEILRKELKISKKVVVK